MTLATLKENKKENVTKRTSQLFNALLLTAYTRKLGIFSDSLEIIPQCIAIVLMEGVDLQTPNISMHILFTTLLSFPVVQMGELNVKQGNQVLIFTP